MKAVIAAVLLLAWPAAAEIPLQLHGWPVEGGLILGKTAPGAVVKVNGDAVEVSKAGDFLLGFGRDSKGVMTISVSADGERILREIEVADRTFKVERIDGLPPRKVTPDPKAIERIGREKKEINAARETSSEVPYYLPGFAWPAIGRISGVYGSQRVLNGKPRRPHFGTDIAAPTGTKITAMAPGRVAFVHPGMFFNGKTVLIDHGLGLRSIYIHLSESYVDVGDQVDTSTFIGAIGATGRATGPHLHFGLTLNKTPIDPEVVLGPMPKP